MRNYLKAAQILKWINECDIVIPYVFDAYIQPYETP